jgi:hypothetical protein
MAHYGGRSSGDGPLLPDEVVDADTLDWSLSGISCSEETRNHFMATSSELSSASSLSSPKKQQSGESGTLL